MRYFILLTFALILQFSHAQIGHVTRNFTDVSRNRQITCDIYYPAVSTGDNTAWAQSGSYPMIVFGHGFALSTGDYDDIRAAIVPQGYVWVSVATVGGLAPVHAQVGLDYAYIIQAMIAENVQSESFFYNRLTGRTALMGHSMGGGCSWLAAANNMEVHCIIGLAPAETNGSSAIGAASLVTAPAMVITGTADAVTPPANNHLPIYTGTASTCKKLVTIQNGSHCGFTDSPTLCDLGEIGFSGLTRAQQQAIVFPAILYWLRLHLNLETIAQQLLADHDAATAQITITGDCVVSVSEGVERIAMSLWPNPVKETLFVRLPSESHWTNTQGVITTLSGQVCKSQLVSAANTAVDVSDLPGGVYVLSVVGNTQIAHAIFLKLE